MSSAPDLICVPLNCDEVEPLLPLVVDGAIDATSDSTVFEHLARCQECQDSLARHDLINLGLETGRDRSLGKPPRARHHRLSWPVATAAAACLMLAVGAAAWFEHAAVARATALAQRVDTHVISVPGPNPQRPCYVVVQGDQVSFIDTQTIDGGAPHERGATHPVKLDK